MEEKNLSLFFKFRTLFLYFKDYGFGSLLLQFLFLVYILFLSSFPFGVVWGGFLFEVTHVKFLRDSCKSTGLFNK